MPITPSWQMLKMRDQIQITRFPSEFSAPNYQLQEETRQLYEHLISNSISLTVDRIDEQGHPWVEYQHMNSDHTTVYHSLMINHDGLEMVST